MAWTAPRTWTTGELVTAAIMNTHVKDNLDYLKTEADKIDDCSQADQTASRAIDGTVYQNTGGKLRLVTVNAQLSVSAADGDLLGDAQILVHTDSSTPPTTQVDREKLSVSIQGLTVAANSVILDVSVSFMVVPSNYYKVTGSSNNDGDAPGLVDWFEWDLH